MIPTMVTDSDGGLHWVQPSVPEYTEYLSPSEGTLCDEDGCDKKSYKTIAEFQGRMRTTEPKNVCIDHYSHYMNWESATGYQKVRP